MSQESVEAAEDPWDVSPSDDERTDRPTEDIFDDDDFSRRKQHSSRRRPPQVQATRHRQQHAKTSSAKSAASSSAATAGRSRGRQQAKPDRGTEQGHEALHGFSQLSSASLAELERLVEAQHRQVGCEAVLRLFSSLDHMLMCIDQQS